MSEKPLVGMNADFRIANRDGAAFTYVASGYFDSLTKAGAIPVVLPPLEETTDGFQRLTCPLGLAVASRRSRVRSTAAR